MGLGADLDGLAASWAVHGIDLLHGTRADVRWLYIRGEEVVSIGLFLSHFCTFSYNGL